MLLLVTGWVVTPIACIYLAYLLISDTSYSITSFSWQVTSWILGFWVFRKVLELFEGLARPR